MLSFIKVYKPLHMCMYTQHINGAMRHGYPIRRKRVENVEKYVKIKGTKKIRYRRIKDHGSTWNTQLM